MDEKGPRRSRTRKEEEENKSLYRNIFTPQMLTFIFMRF